MRGALLVVIVAVAAILLVSKAEGAPSKPGEKTEAILTVPSAPLDEGRIEQALNRLKEELGKPSTSAEDSGFDGEDLSAHQIKTLLQKGEKQSSVSSAESPAKDAAQEDVGQKAETFGNRDGTRTREVAPFRTPPMSYLKEVVGDEDHEFFFEEPRRNSFHGASFRDVFDDAEEKNDDDDDEDDDDDDESSDDTVFRSAESRRPNPRKTNKGSRSEDFVGNDAAYLVEPDAVVAEHTETHEDPEKIVPEKEVMHVVDDELLRPKEVHKYSDGSSFDIHTPELLADLESNGDISLSSSDLIPTQLVDGETLTSLSATVDSTDLSPLPDSPPLFVPSLESMISESSTAQPASSPIPSTESPRTTEMLKGTSEDRKPTVLNDESTLTTVTASKAATEVPPAATTEKIKSIATEKPVPAVTTTVKPTTAAPSTVQKIPQFIKSIYEAATQKLPSFIHAQGVDAGLLSPPKQSPSAVSSGSGTKTPGNSSSGSKISGSPGSGNKTSGNLGPESDAQGSSSSSIATPTTGPGNTKSGGPDPGSKAPGSSSSGGSSTGSSGPGSTTPGSGISGSSAPGDGTSESSSSGSSGVPSKAAEVPRPVDPQTDNGQAQTEQLPQAAPGRHPQVSGSSPPPNSQDSHGPSGSVSKTVPPGGVSNTAVPLPTANVNTTTPEPVQENQSTTSSPQDTPIGTLVKGKACEGQTMSKLDRVIEFFPARLPELHEFKRRRFLRAAVIGGLHTMKSTQRNVTCNLTSRTTYWGYKLRGQLDGILNLGITGLPRMYLRYTGPLTVKVVMSAIGNETRPFVDSVTVEESRVDEIHYQSVLGFEQPFVERATKYLLQRAMKEEIVDPITNALMDEIQNPKPDKSKVLMLDDLKNQRKF